jgi:hypothetical protein
MQFKGDAMEGGKRLRTTYLEYINPPAPGHVHATQLDPFYCSYLAHANLTTLPR